MIHIDLDMHAACAVIFDSSTQRVLLTKRAAGMSHPGSWCNPGGKIDSYDETPLDACHREVAEEIGVDLSQHEHTAVMVHVIPGRSDGIAVFFFDVPEAEIPIEALSLAPDEVDAAQWYPIAQALWGRPSAGWLMPGSVVQLQHLVDMQRTTARSL